MEMTVTDTHPALSFERAMRTPLGPLRLLARDGALIGVYFAEHKGAPPKGAPEARGEDPVLAHAERELRAYFAGERRAFTVPTRAEGTAFQRAVWAQLARIGPGETLSYAQLAVRVGNEKAVRAVGGANGANPLSIVVPCHRVIATSGALTGYAGGTEAKRWLLEHERAWAKR